MTSKKVDRMLSWSGNGYFLLASVIAIFLIWWGWWGYEKSFLPAVRQYSKDRMVALGTALQKIGVEKAEPSQPWRANVDNLQKFLEKEAQRNSENPRDLDSNVGRWEPQKSHIWIWLAGWLPGTTSPKPFPFEDSSKPEWQLKNQVLTIAVYPAVEDLAQNWMDYCYVMFEQNLQTGQIKKPRWVHFVEGRDKQC